MCLSRFVECAQANLALLLGFHKLLASCNTSFTTLDFSQPQAPHSTANSSAGAPSRALCANAAEHWRLKLVRLQDSLHLLRVSEGEQAASLLAILAHAAHEDSVRVELGDAGACAIVHRCVPMQDVPCVLPFWWFAVCSVWSCAICSTR